MIVGFDTHALSYAAFMSVVEVLTANQVKMLIQKNDGFTQHQWCLKRLFVQIRQHLQR